MNKVTRILPAILLTSVLAGCATQDFKIPVAPDFSALTQELEKATKEVTETLAGMERPEYTGTDSVGAVNSSSLIGTWQVAILNKAPIEPELNIVMTINEDGSFDATAKHDFKEPIGKLEYELKGTWSVQGENVSITTVSARETSGNKLAGPDEEIYDGEADLFNIYESRSDYLVVFDEGNGVAQSYTRLN